MLINFSYSLCSSGCGMYLPHNRHVNIWFIRKQLNREKKAMKSVDVNHLHVPHFKELSIQKFLDFASSFPQVADFLPDPQDIHLYPRQVSPIQSPCSDSMNIQTLFGLQRLCNVLSTVIGKPIKGFVQERISQRHTQLVEKLDLNVQVDPEILAIIRASQAVSVQKGYICFLMKKQLPDVVLGCSQNSRGKCKKDRPLQWLKKML